MQAVLLIGFSQYEVDAFRKFMIDMDADMVKVSLQDAKRNSCCMVTLAWSLDDTAQATDPAACALCLYAAQYLFCIHEHMQTLNVCEAWSMLNVLLQSPLT